jgi:hypothetical protein
VKPKIRDLLLELGDLRCIARRIPDPAHRGRDRLVTPRGVGLWGIAVDDSTIYWTNISDGTLSAIAR